MANNKIRRIDKIKEYLEKEGYEFVERDEKSGGNYFINNTEDVLPEIVALRLFILGEN